MTAAAAQGRALFGVHAAAGLLSVAVFSGVLDYPITAGVAGLALMVIARGQLEPHSIKGGWLVVGGLLGTSMGALAPALRLSTLSSGGLAGASAALGPALLLRPATASTAMGFMFVIGVLAAVMLLGRTARRPGPFDAPLSEETVMLSKRLDLHEAIAVSAALAAAVVGPAWGVLIYGPKDPAAIAGAIALAMAGSATFWLIRWLTPLVRRGVGGPAWPRSRWVVLVGSQIVLGLLAWVGR